jgi:virginiamycin B lyase
LAAQPGAAHAASPTITEYTVPTATAWPWEIAAGPDGNMWFAEYFKGKIGRVTPDGTFTEWPVNPNVQKDARSIVAGPDGAMWFTFGHIGRITMDGTVTRYHLPPGHRANEICLGADGALWFTEESANEIGRMTTSGKLRQFALPAGTPERIAAAPDGSIWFTDAANYIGRLSPPGQVIQFPIPSTDSEPEGITAGPDDAMWFTEWRQGKIGRITTDGTLTEYPVGFVSYPTAITSAYGALWFTEDAAIGRISTSGDVTKYHEPSRSFEMEGIAPGPGDTVWFTAVDSNSVGFLSPS